MSTGGDDQLARYVKEGLQDRIEHVLEIAIRLKYPDVASVSFVSVAAGVDRIVLEGENLPSEEEVKAFLDELKGK